MDVHSLRIVDICRFVGVPLISGKMGKKQHQKDKLYLTATEWTTLYGGRRANDEYHTHSERSQFKRLPYDHCSLSLQPFRDPYCTDNGVIYDITNIVPFIQRHGLNPFDGSKLEIKQLVKLNFHKNSDGMFHCPVLFKVFNENSHIVAVKTSGNVFSYEAVEQLNIKANYFCDLITDVPFTKKDIIQIQNPTNLDKFNITNFHYIKNNLKFADEEKVVSNLGAINNETRETLKELSTLEENSFLKKLAESQKEAPSEKSDKYNSAHFSTGKASASFTSTVMEPVVKVEAAVIDKFSMRYQFVKKKGYVRLVTNFGNLNLELFCDQVPKTCDNFIQLCKKGYYDGVKFHRSIKHFMIQGGDPTGTGQGGESIFGKPFEDEFNKLFSHEGRGVLSMANSGPNTNKSQFFITFRSCKHLDNKHTIFGKVVGGMDVLTSIENVKTDEKDRPLENIKILSTLIFVDPYQEADELIEKERQNDIDREKVEKKKIATQKKQFSKGVGSFINLEEVHKSLKRESDVVNKTKKIKASSNFDNW